MWTKAQVLGPRFGGLIPEGISKGMSAEVVERESSEFWVVKGILL